MITEDYISFELAKLLKEKGFLLPSINFRDWLFCMYDENGDIQWGCYSPDWYARVTHQLAMKWLRKEHNLFIEPYYTVHGFRASVTDTKTGNTIYTQADEDVHYDSPEASCESIIQYCLKNLI